MNPEVLNVMMSYMSESDKSKLLSINYDQKMARLIFTNKLKPNPTLEHFTVGELKTLETKGYILKDSFIKDESLLDAVVKEVTSMYTDGFLKQAYMSKGQDRWADKNFRGDFHAWINDKEKVSLMWPNTSKILEILDRLRIELNREVDFNGTRVSV